MFVSQSWIESRLNMSEDIFEEDDDYVILTQEFFDNLWQPDPYFLNSKVSGKLYLLSHILRVKLSGIHSPFLFQDCTSVMS